ncbi:hypothetical protein Cni_G00795 [Canna indica]|uniref:Uncharacterized protein n=1 Tax=Canna indica TaxID=4628 RepID=A0AAQ3JLH2_9LILI|nr:hypothetical protein Cni_G00795 [Canna indica]
MKKRWARAALVACLILLIASPHGLARSVSSRKHAHRHRQRAEEKTTSTKEDRLADAEVVTVHRHGCRWKKVDLCGGGYLTPAEKNESLVDDDKRRVPTGPNPLHNR